MIRLSFLTSVCTFLLFTFGSYAQSTPEYYIQAEDYIEDENYYKALEIFQKLLSESPNNANLNFKVGFCFLNTATEKSKAIPYLEFASNHITTEYRLGNVNETGAPVETLFYLGKAYHVNYRIDDAERIFYQLKKQLSSEDKDFIDRVDHELASCQVARLLMKSPVEMKVSNLGRNINSTFTEHSPVISGDESLLIFTSKRESNTGGIKTDDGQYFEDIYLSSFDGKNYTLSQKISTNVNSPGHEASIGLSFDGTKLFIYKDDNGDGNIYISNRKGAEWQIPEILPEVINSKYRETHASMSFEQDEIFFTSDRKGGFGGLDIYRVRKLPNGNWSKAQNLGPEINTRFDEEGPYLHPDGTSLFFASKGHNSMGGFDIFVSFVDEDSKWSTPQNIGYPINTPDDDIYYVPSVDGRRAYYASYTNNSIGSYDIFRIDLSESHIRNQTVIAGIARSSTGILLKNPVITLNNPDDELVGIYTPDPETGKFLFILPRGQQFFALFESSNFSPFTIQILVPEFSYDQSQQVVVFDEIIIPRKEVLASSENPLQQTEKETSIKPIEISVKEVKIEQTEKENLTVSQNKNATQELLISSELKTSPQMNQFEDYTDTNLISAIDEKPGYDTENNALPPNETSPRDALANTDFEQQKTESIFWWLLIGGILVSLVTYLTIKRKKQNV